MFCILCRRRLRCAQLATGLFLAKVHLGGSLDLSCPCWVVFCAETLPPHTAQPGPHISWGYPGCAQKWGYWVVALLHVGSETLPGLGFVSDRAARPMVETGAFPKSAAPSGVWGTCALAFPVPLSWWALRPTRSDHTWVQRVNIPLSLECLPFPC